MSFFGTVYEMFVCCVCTSVLPIVNVSIFANMSPVFTAILAVCMLGERLTLGGGIQVIAAFIGVVMIISGRHTTVDSATGQG